MTYVDTLLIKKIETVKTNVVIVFKNCYIALQLLR